ncbi:MAG: hypothetical protein KF729_23450 [Sandaracinaceae bacterium]|nr:hypothetical protein [Sandaracinaceae bacterium]
MSRDSTIRFATFPSTRPPPTIAFEVVEAFRSEEHAVASVGRMTGMKSDAVLAAIAPELIEIGFQVEVGKQNHQRLERPVFFGENGEPTVQYSIDAFHPGAGCGLEVEAGRAWMSNAVYRDLVQALVMVDVQHLILCVANEYRFRSAGRIVVNPDYSRTVEVARALFGHSRVKMPYGLTVVGY